MLFFFLFFFISSLYSDELTVDPPLIWPECIPCRPPLVPSLTPQLAETVDNIIVDLIDPLYENETLSTEHGGVFIAPNLRIQAQKIMYIKKPNEEKPIVTVACQGNLLIDYREWALVGDYLFYDFIAQKGFLINGRTAVPPWYIGGREIQLLEDGTLYVLDGSITTSEGEVEDVVLRSSTISLSPDRILTAKNVHLCLHEVPIFWLPIVELDLDNIGRIPFAVKFGWGGFRGSYISILYRFFSWRDLKATARFDAFFGKGIGLGIETVYNPPWRATQLYTRNYYAHDIPLDDPTRRDRYRFQGTYHDRYWGILVDGMYDFVSDAEMASDYTTKDFDLKTAGRTQIEFRHKEKGWVANLFARVRVNDFQSVNQELPSFLLNFHPFEIPSTGILFENCFKASYLDYVFSDDVQPKRDFSAARIAMHPFLYRPTFFGPLTATPELGFIGIAYTNSPDGGFVAQGLGQFGLKAESAFSKCFSQWKHTVEPYIHYTLLTHPTIAPDHHFIFTINDGWDYLNQMRFGIRNSFFTKQACFARPLWVDLWANAFFATQTIPQVIPKAYLDVEWTPYERLFIGMDSGWLFKQRKLDFYNIRIDWTVNAHLAFGIEYRHRSRFDWRKADFYNFILESVRSQEELLISPLSDQRDTFILRAFAHLTPEWTAKFNLRHGWNRLFQDRPQPTFLEYQVELSRIIFQHWKLTFNYENKETDHRYSFSLLMHPGPPPRKKYCY